MTAAPDLVLGILYVTLLVDRSALPGLVLPLARSVPIEFAVVHASGFLVLPWVARWTNVRKRALYVAALAGAYSLALGIVSLAMGGIWPLAIFWGLMVNRMLAVIVGDLPDDRAFTAWAMAWAGTTTLYVFSVIAGAFGGQARLTQALVVGFGYFTAVGVSELTGWSWVHRWMQRARARAGASRSGAGSR